MSIRRLSSSPGPRRPACTQQLPFRAISMMRHPGLPTRPDKARHADTNCSWSLGSAIFLLPCHVVDLVVDLHVGIASWETDAEGDDPRGFRREGKIRPDRVEYVQDDQPLLRLGRNPGCAKPADMPDRSPGRYFRG